MTSAASPVWSCASCRRLSGAVGKTPWAWAVRVCPEVGYGSPSLSATKAVGSQKIFYRAAKVRTHRGRSDFYSFGGTT